MTALSEFPLRERKQAQTKIDILHETAKRLTQSTLDELSIKPMCQSLLLSEATFFNYFPNKQHLINSLSNLWMLELCAQHAQTTDKGLENIHQIFLQNAQQITTSPGVFNEMIALRANSQQTLPTIEFSELERMLAFPQLSGITEIEVIGLEGLIVPALDTAISLGQLPSNCPKPTILVNLLTIFFGVPFLLANKSPQNVANMYKQQLYILWAGIKTHIGQMS